MLNRVILIGRLTKDPELRYTDKGVAITQFTLAVNRPFKNNGEQEADFIPVVTWDKLAESTAKNLKKGRLIATEGRIEVRSYETEDGKRAYSTKVVTSNIRYLDSNKDNKQANNPDPFLADSKPMDFNDDDLPF